MFYKLIIKIINQRFKEMLEQFFPEKLQHAQYLKVLKSQVLDEIKVSLKTKQSETFKIILTKDCIFLQKIPQMNNDPNEDYFYAVKIQFELSFQILSEVDGGKNKDIGLTLIKQSGDKFTFYTSDPYSLSSMKKSLIKVIHQRDFHSKFVPTNKIGKGNFATVYEVLRHEDGKKFAVKAFSKKSVYSVQKGKQALKNQLLVMRQISGCSKNLISLEEVYESDASIYAVQQLLHGKNLAQLMKTKTEGLNYQQTCCILKGLLLGIKSLNERKIMHRDLKPENIVFRTNKLNNPQTYDPVIIDYGMCARFDKWPYMFSKCGTPGYTAPQIANLKENVQYSPVCDMFSIGCLFHLIMTGSPIFDTQSAQQIWLKNKSLQFDIKKNKIKKCHPLALDLLEKLIENIPSLRITVDGALCHEFFGMKHFPFQSKLSLPNSIQETQAQTKNNKSFIKKLFSS